MERAASSWHGVELRHLAALETVARERSFSAAAEVLGYTQSAISSQITALERIVGARLFARIRGTRGVELTDEGRLLLEHAAAITARIHAARADLHASRNGGRALLRVGTFQTVSQSVLPDVLRRLAQGPEPVRASLYEDAAIERLVTLLDQGDLDVSFVLLPIADPLLETLPVLEDPWYLLLRADHPLAKRGVISIPMLDGVPLISLERVSIAGEAVAPRSTRLVEESILAAGVMPDIALRLNDYRSISVMVEAGLGCGLVPSLALGPGQHGLVARPIERVPPRIVGIAWNRERQKTHAIGRFVDAVRTTAARRVAA
ncbi:MAG TPA: LysR family transcriptional regulator [Gaiellaceae bacterium]|nr:LysR family transcriptional regulator [Gaiellaceae bacterium]